MTTPIDRESVERLAEKLEKAVAREMSRVCNEYAKDGNMTAATAIHDAQLCVQKTLRAALQEKTND